MSAVTLLGNPAEMYYYGTQFFMIGIAYIVTAPIAAYLFMPVYYRLELTSAYEVFLPSSQLIIKKITLVFSIWR